MLGLAGDDDAAVGQHHLDRHERVDRQAVLADEPADPAPEGQAGDPDAARVTERRREAMLRGGRGVLAGAQAGLSPGKPPGRVDVEALHRAEVEHDAALARAIAGKAVRPTTDRELETRLAGEHDGPCDIRRRRCLDDADRAQVGVRVVDLAGQLVALVVGTDDRAADPGGERRQVVRAEGVVGGDAGKGHRGVFLSGGGAPVSGGVRRWSSPTVGDAAGTSRRAGAHG